MSHFIQVIKQEVYFNCALLTVWPDWAIYWTLGKFLKPLATINFAQISHILRQFLERCQNLQFFYWNHFWATFIDIWRFVSGHTEDEQNDKLDVTKLDRSPTRGRWTASRHFFSWSNQYKMVNKVYKPVSLGLELCVGSSIVTPLLAKIFSLLTCRLPKERLYTHTVKCVVQFKGSFWLQFKVSFGQYYKQFTIVIYDLTGVMNVKLLILRSKRPL